MFRENGGDAVCHVKLLLSEVSSVLSGEPEMFFFPEYSSPLKKLQATLSSHLALIWGSVLARMAATDCQSQMLAMCAS